MTPYLVAGCAVLGVVVGSFLNVVASRVPLHQSVIRPASRCPRCHAAILRRDNVPVLSWMILRRRCRYCRVAIPARYPLVEGLTAVAFALVAARFGLSWELAAYLVFTACLMVVSTTDIELGEVPSAVVTPALVATAALLALAASLGTRWDDLARAAVGGAGAWLLAKALSQLRPDGAGPRVLRLAPLLGAHLAFLGLGHLLAGTLLAGVLCAVVTLAARVAGVPQRGLSTPVAPLLFIATLVVVFLGTTLSPW